MYIHYLIVSLFSRKFNTAWTRNTGIVVKDVQPAVRGDRRSDHVFQLDHVLEICTDKKGIPSDIYNFLHCLMCIIFVDISNRHLSPLFGKQDGRSPTNSRGSPRYQGDFSFKLHCLTASVLLGTLAIHGDESAISVHPGMKSLLL